MTDVQTYYAMILPRLCCKSEVGQPHQPNCPAGSSTSPTTSEATND